MLLFQRASSASLYLPTDRIFSRGVKRGVGGFGDRVKVCLKKPWNVLNGVYAGWKCFTEGTIVILADCYLARSMRSFENGQTNKERAGDWNKIGSREERTNKPRKCPVVVIGASVIPRGQTICRKYGSS